METKVRRVRLEGLNDTCKIVMAASVQSITEAMRFVYADDTITAVGGDGAINVWKDKFGRWRCELCQHRMTTDSKTCHYKADVRRWLKRVWHRMGK